MCYPYLFIRSEYEIDVEKLSRRSLLGGSAAALASVAGCSSDNSSENAGTTTSESTVAPSETTSSGQIKSNVVQSPGVFEIPEVIFIKGQASGYNEYTRKPNAEYEPAETIWYYYNVNGIHYEETEEVIRTDLSIYETLEGPDGNILGEAERKIPITNEFQPGVSMSNYYGYESVESPGKWSGGTYTITIKVIDQYVNKSINESGSFHIPKIQSNYLEELRTDPRFPDGGGTISRTFDGEPGYFFDTEFTFEIPQGMYEYYGKKLRPYQNNFQRKYGSYVSTAIDDAYISYIVDWFRGYGERNGHSEAEILNHIISFVHRLQYIDDKVGTGYDEYPKYPAETLVERGGDCEDIGILLASLLESMGYETRLLIATSEMMEGDQGHAAVGINGDFSGYYFEDDGKRFYYIETTATATSNEETASGKIGVDHSMNRAYTRPVDEAPLLALNGEVTQADGNEITVSGYVLNTSTADTSSARVEAKLVNEEDYIVAEGVQDDLYVQEYDYENPSDSEISYNISLTLEDVEPLRLVIDGYIGQDLVARNTSNTVFP